MLDTLQSLGMQLDFQYLNMRFIALPLVKFNIKSKVSETLSNSKWKERLAKYSRFSE